MNCVTLSFDNGPTPGITEGVLEVLARYGVLSTFFVIGQRLELPTNAALLQVITAAGHRVGNHTWSHSVAFGDRLDAAYAREEIDRAQALIGEQRVRRSFSGRTAITGCWGNTCSAAARSPICGSRATPLSAGRPCLATGAVRTGTAISRSASAPRIGRLWFCTTSKMLVWPVCRISWPGCRIAVLNCVTIFPRASS
jgi:peptidoglycan/xylan/chitin deacetylase (PgdA/CDA1 family)